MPNAVQATRIRFTYPARTNVCSFVCAASSHSALCGICASGKDLTSFMDGTADQPVTCPQCHQSVVARVQVLALYHRADWLYIVNLKRKDDLLRNIVLPSLTQNVDFYYIPYPMMRGPVLGTYRTMSSENRQELIRRLDTIWFSECEVRYGGLIRDHAIHGWDFGRNPTCNDMRELVRNLEE